MLPLGGNPASITEHSSLFSVITRFYASSSLAASSLCSSPSHQNHSWFSPKGNSLYLWPFARAAPSAWWPSPPVLWGSSEVSPPLTAFCELQLRLISHPLCSPRAPLPPASHQLKRPACYLPNPGPEFRRNLGLCLLIFITVPEHPGPFLAHSGLQNYLLDQ